jgi:glutamate/tyrosine decarboxylase-like PLP-dependent enzyme
MEPGSDNAPAGEERWAWPAERIKKFGYQVVDLIADHLTNLRSRPVFQPFPRTLAERYLEFAPPPESGEDEEAILRAFEQEIEPFPFGNGHPCFYGWVNSPPVAVGIFAEALAAAMNPSCAGGNHAAIYVERQVVNWFKHIAGYPPDAMGLLVSGGSMAALTALAAARHAACGADIRCSGMQGVGAPLRIYKTAEGHGCYEKAAELLGIGSENVRLVEQDENRRMSPEALDASIREDVNGGLLPMCVIASAGTVNTGAIDPLAAIGDVCAKYRVWLHVDGAYGAPAILTSEYRDLLKPLSRADSIALDPHKWLYVPVEAGLVLVRHAEILRAAFSLIPPYLRTDGKPEGVWGLPWFSEYGFQQTRGFRALKVWMALRYHGLAGYRASLERDIALAGHLASRIRKAAQLELCEPQNLSIVCFRFAPRALKHDRQALNAVNKALVEKIQLSGKAFVSSTTLGDTFWVRACIINPLAKEEDIDHLVEMVEAAGETLLP